MSRQFANSSGIMLIPEPHELFDEESHVTLAYAGKRMDSYGVKEMLDLAVWIANEYSPVETQIIGEDWLGAGDTHVWMVEKTDKLMLLREHAVRFNKSGFNTWRPHITSRYRRANELPVRVVLHIIEVWHYGKRVTYPLNGTS